MGMTERRAENGSAKHALFELQVEQHRHDETYHREIARLTLHQRLNHTALHLAKCAGKVAAADNVESMTPVYVDTFIIALSTASILNIELWFLLGHADHDVPGLLTFARILAAQHGLEMTDRNEL